jgi:TolB protein
VPKPSGVSGKLAYTVVTNPAPEHHSIWTIKTDGTGASKVLDAAAWPAFSPDGKKLAFYQLGFGGKNAGLYVGDAFGGNAVAAVVNVGACCFHWSRDGQWIVYTLSNKPNQPGGPIQMVKADGTFKTIVDLKVVGNGPSFSTDGKQVVFSGCEPGTNTCGVRVVATDGSGTVRTVTRDNGGNAEWSPRGDKIVYQADGGAGNIQVFVVNPDGSGRKQLTTGKGNDGQPIWSRDGSAIFWRSDQNHTAWAIYVMNADGTNRRKIVSDIPPDPNLWGWESLSIAP